MALLIKGTPRIFNSFTGAIVEASCFLMLEFRIKIHLRKY